MEERASIWLVVLAVPVWMVTLDQTAKQVQYKNHNFLIMYGTPNPDNFGSMDRASVYGTASPWFDSCRAAIWQQNWSQRCVWSPPSVSRYMQAGAVENTPSSDRM